MKPCNLHSVQPKLALSPMANFLVYVFTIFSGCAKRLLPGTGKTNTSTHSFELPYIKNDSAFVESFLISQPVLVREYTLERTKGKFVAFNKLQVAANNTISIPSQKTPSSINFFNQKSMQTKLRLLGITLSVILLSFVTTSVFGQATVTSDKEDYAPRSNAVFTGAGFAPGETVVLKVKNLNRPCNTVTADSSYLAWSVVADAGGGFVTNWTVCDCNGDSLRLKATGQTSNLIAYAYFVDAARTWTGAISTDWSEAGNWSAAPGSADDVIIPSGSLNYPILTSSQAFSIKSLTINASAQLTVNAGASLTADGGNSINNGSLNTAGTLIFGSNRNLSGTGTLTVAGGITSLGDLTISTLNMSSGTLQSAGAFNPTSFSPTGGTIEYNGANQSVKSTTYNHLLISNSNTKTLTGAITVNGNLTINSSVGLDVSNGNNYPISVAGNWINNGSFTQRSGTVTFNGGAQSISGSTITAFSTIAINNGSTVTGSTASTATTANINSGGKYIQITGTTMLGSSTKNFVSGSTYELQTALGGTGFSGSTYGNLIINFSGSTSLQLGGVLTTVANNLTVKNTGTATLRFASSQNPTVAIGGNFIIEVGNVEASSTTGVSIINVIGNLQQSGGILRLSTSSTGGQQLNVTGNVQLIGGTFQPMISTGVPSISVKGNWDNSGGTFTAGSTTVTFNGITTKDIGGTTSTTFNGLTIAKTGGAGITLSQNETVSGTLTMTSGNIDCGPNTLELGTSTSTPGTLDYTADKGNIVGSFKRWFNSTGAKQFPLGKSLSSGTATATHNALVTFNNLTNGSLTAKFIASDPSNAGLPLAENSFNITNQFIEGYWSLVSGDGLASNNYNLELSGINFSSYTIDENTRIIKRPDAGGNWTLNGTHVNAVSSIAKRAGLNGFSQFALAAAAACTDPTISDQPDNVIACTDGSAVFNISASGPGSITYQWYKENGVTDIALNDEDDGADIQITNSGATLTINNVVAADAGGYYVLVSRTCGSATTSTTADLTVHPQFTAGAINTTGQTICYNADPAVIGSATASSGGFGTITYKWQSSVLGDFTDAVDIASNTATYDPAALTQTTTFRRLAHDATCNTSFEVSAGVWTVTVHPPTIITGHFINGTPGTEVEIVYGCTTPVLSVTATGQGTITYKWFKNTTNSNSGGTQITLSSTNPSYTVPPITPVGTYYYYVEVTAGCGMVKSNVFKVVIKPQEAEAENESSLYYTGPANAWTPTATSNTATVTLSAFVKNASNDNCGDIATARITFQVKNSSGVWTDIPSAQNLPVYYVDPNNPSRGGTAAAIVQLNISNNTTQIFDLRVVVSGNYTSNYAFGCSQITVSKLVPGGSISGGVVLCGSTSTGLLRPSSIIPSLLGFGVEYVVKQGKAQSPKGKVNLYVPSYFDLNGTSTFPTLNWYKITSNAIAGLAITSPTATFTSKANVSKYNPVTGEVIPIEGNCTVVFDLKDIITTGHSNNQDLVGITIYRNAGGAWYSNNWVTSKTEARNICLGDLTVSGITSASTTPVARINTSATTTQVDVTPAPTLLFDIKASPNPTTSYFNVKLESDNISQPISLNVVDISGKVIEMRKNLVAGQTFQLGAAYRPGMYFVELLQGDRRRIVKLVKQPD
jgi:hypothetical protein